MATSAATAVYLGAAEPVSYSAWGGAAAASVNAPGLPETRPFWIFVNDAVITEMAEYPEAIDWRLTTSAWPGLVPGCCEGGTVAPASPTDPWPAQGWPSDGFYSTTATVRDGQIDVTLRKWLSCSQHPDMCAPWWTGDEVTTDPDAPTLQQSIPFDQELTVVILPILSDRAIVGDGHALETLLNDLNTAIEIWMTDSGYDELLELSEDPSFPFGGPASDALLGGDQMGYRGPGGMHLTPYGDTASLPGWTTLEVRDGRPILYIHAGIIAG